MCEPGPPRSYLTPLNAGGRWQNSAPPWSASKDSARSSATQKLSTWTRWSFASDIYADAERLNEAFKEMLELDRMEAGRTVLEVDRVDINDLV